MRRVLFLALLGLYFGVPGPSASLSDTGQDYGSRLPEHAVLSFAVIGDGEPKPDAEFPGLEAAVKSINDLASVYDISFVAGVGDIAHKGTVAQYDAALDVFRDLVIPFYPIMGNEEYNASVERYLAYANRWNQGRVIIDALKYVIETDQLALIFATPEKGGRDFYDKGVQWIEDQLDAIGDKPAMLFIHGAPQEVFPEGGDKGVANPEFLRLMNRPNLVATFSGDLHMDLTRVQGAREEYGVHHVHVPALERTKLPDKAQHVPYYRLVSVLEDGEVVVSTINAVTGKLQPSLDYRFSLERR